MSQVDQRMKIQLDQLQATLVATQQQCKKAETLAEQRAQLIRTLANALSPETMIGLLDGSGSGADGQTQMLKDIPLDALVARVISDVTLRQAKLTQFDTLTAAEQQRALVRLLQTDFRTWTGDNDPRLVQLAEQIRQAEQAQAQTEERARQTEAARQRLEVERNATQVEVQRLRNEMAQLRAQPKPLPVPPPPLASSLPPTPAPAIPTVPSMRSDAINPAVSATPSVPVIPPAPASPLTPTAASSVVAPVEPEYELDPEPEPGIAPEPAAALVPAALVTDALARDPVAVRQQSATETLITLLATRGLCEGQRIRQIIYREFGIGNNPQHADILGAFKAAREGKLIQVLEPKQEAGSGRNQLLVRLTDAGIALARRLNEGVEPVESELTRLLQAHDTPEHVMLILLTRQAFLENYPPGEIDRVDIFPAPIPVGGERRSEPDADVFLLNGKVWHIECERNTTKDREERRKKWNKYFLATQGIFRIVTPDQKGMTTLQNELALWYAEHGGKVMLSMTNLYHVFTREPGASFWVIADLPLGVK